jgi:hypothetical protein
VQKAEVPRRAKTNSRAKCDHALSFLRLPGFQF